MMRHKGLSRLVELGKSLLILLLALSMLFLLGRVLPDSVMDSVRGVLDKTPIEQPQSVTAQDASSAVHPTALAVYQDGRRYGVQYDQEKTDEAFSSFSMLFSEALSSAGGPAAVSEQDWRFALCSTGVYLDLLYPVPLSTLSGWLGDGTVNPALTGTARRICLAADGDDGVSLFYINENDGSYYASATTLSLSFHLEAALEGWAPNGVTFAFEEPDMGRLAPYTLLTATPRPAVCTAQNPLLGDSARVAELLNVLGFHAQENALDPARGGQLVEGSDFLRLSADGLVNFHSIGDSGYRFSVGESGTQNALDYVQDLAEKTVGAWCGKARLCLAGLEQSGERLEIVFQYALDGAMIALPEERAAARFVVENGAVTDFSLYLRAYSATEEISLVLPEVQAIAAMGALGVWGKELTLLYQDTGGDLISAGWVAK